MKEYIDKNKLLDTLNIQRKYLIEKNTIYDHYTSGFDDCCDMVEDFEELEDVAHVLKNATTLTPQNEWISVKDRLPEDEKPVLAYYGFYHDDDSNEDLGARYIGTLTYFTYDPDPHWQHESTGLFVTHWMPLPEPPEE